MKKIISLALIFAVVGGAAAIADTKSDRETVMKANGGATRALRPLTTAFDAAAVKAQGQVLVDNAGKIAVLFAPGTDQTDPDALPAIWTDAAGFKAATDKFAADAQAVMNAADGPGLQTALMAVNGDCNNCHRSYRKPPARRGPPPAQ